MQEHYPRLEGEATSSEGRDVDEVHSEVGRVQKPGLWHAITALGILDTGSLTSRIERHHRL